jgi:hypothetical protein
MWRDLYADVPGRIVAEEEAGAAPCVRLDWLKKRTLRETSPHPRANFDFPKPKGGKRCKKWH